MRTTAKLVLAAAASTGLMLGAQGLASADESPFLQPQQEQQQPQQEQQEPQQDQQQPQQEQQEPQQDQQQEQDFSPSDWALSGILANMDQ
ncbi:hypothetical protein [Saccharopolyspora shandongensis]|uniref:hypothetical protein n=1 Tax=Saccharopolyspora shandongensis TaxID=418495 RepID=UPI0033F38F7C